jgi:hypothetical protein
MAAASKARWRCRRVFKDCSRDVEMDIRSGGGEKEGKGHQHQHQHSTQLRE